MKQLTEAELRQLIEEYFKQVVNDIEDSFLNIPRPLTVEAHEDRLKAVDSLSSDFRECLGRADYRGVTHVAEILLQDNGFSVDRESLLFKKLCREILKVCVDTLEIEEKSLRGQYEKTVFQKPLPPVSPQLQPKETTELLSTVVAKYCEEQDRGGNWSARTKYEVEACLSLLQVVIGDVPVNSVDHKTMRGYKQTLMQLPANKEKNPKYRGKSIDELLRMQVDTPMSITTVNKYMRWAASLFKFAVKNGFLSMNPAEGMHIKQSKRDDELRDVFAPEDLLKLFHSAEYLEDAHKTSYGFWVPLLGLYTGCRLEEICQLHLDDVRQEGGVWVLDINNAGEKRLKTKAALRLVPLHPFLVDELKLPEYVAKLRDQGHQRLFPELQQKRDGYGQNVSKWFGKFRKRCGVVAAGGKQKDFHSFRHLFINTLKQSHTIDPAMISEVVGHEVPSITMGRYGKRYSPQTLLEEAIMKLGDFGGLDLGGLKTSRFVGREQGV